MSIFNDHINNEILMGEMFKITSLSYITNSLGAEEIGNLRLSGDPLNLHNIKWVFPEQYLNYIEPKYYEAIMKEYCRSSSNGFVPISYHFGPEGFSCTHDGDRLFLHNRDIIKEEHYKSKDDVSFAAVLFDEVLRYTKVDKLFTPEVFGPDPEDAVGGVSPFPWLDMQYRTKTYNNYWLSVVNKLLEAMRSMISPELETHIDIAIDCTRRSTPYSVRLMCYFQFISYKNNPLYWFFIDRSRCLYIDPLKKNFHMSKPLNTAPYFIFCIDLVIKQ